MALATRVDTRRLAFLVSAVALVGVAARAYVGSAHRQVGSVALAACLLVLAAWLAWGALRRSPRDGGSGAAGRLTLPPHAVLLISFAGAAAALALAAAIRPLLTSGWSRAVGVAVVVAIGLGTISTLARVARRRFDGEAHMDEADTSA